MNNIKQLLGAYKKQVALGFVVVLIFGVWFVWKNNKANTDQVATTEQQIQVSLATETLGEIIGTTSDDVGTSWPGEIISAGDVEVQPAREGTIVEWKAKIGQRVTQGQVLARLSAPPATPELTRTLAEQAQNLTRARAQAQAQATF